MIYTELFDKIKSGNYNLVIFATCFVLLFYIFNYISNCKKNIEKMADASDAQINDAVKKFYSSDEFIRNITAVSLQTQKDGLKINGDLIVTGQIKATGEISNNSFSLSGLNSKIDKIPK